ncbi:hypothetical protein [Heyndrickxia ginsengihumi]|uniref:hypothetical protein n=1 Tax=Heyndrickxia ginsengihumi TaxID=363870 RepID=UPI003D1E842C
MSVLSLAILIPSKADAATYRYAPIPTGKWTYVKTMKYHTANTATPKQFAAGVASYVAGSLRGKGTAAVAPG